MSIGTAALSGRERSRSRSSLSDLGNDNFTEASASSDDDSWRMRSRNNNDSGNHNAHMNHTNSGSFSSIVQRTAPNSIFSAATEMVYGPKGGIKDDIVLYTDGSIESDLPMQQLSELFNVNHFIVSQVNAHSALFSASSVQASVWSPWWFGACVGYVRFLKAFVKGWISNIVDLWVYRLKAPLWASRRGLAQLLTQEYEGREQDITIMPWVHHLSLLKAFSETIKVMICIYFLFCFLFLSFFYTL